jgi:hypothetical protein
MNIRNTILTSTMIITAMTPLIGSAMGGGSWDLGDIDLGIPDDYFLNYPYGFSDHSDTISARDDFAVADANSDGVWGNVLMNDSTQYTDALKAKLQWAPANGTVTLNEDGSFHYTPNPGFFGDDQFRYRAHGYVQYPNSDATTQIHNFGDVMISVMPGSVHSLTVEPGWNLISLPAMPQNASIDRLLISDRGEPLFHGDVFEWDADAQAFAAVAVLEAGVGYWMYCPLSESETIEYSVPVDETYSPQPLRPGWNLVGPVNETGDTADFDGMALSYRNGRYERTATARMQNGRGYWIYCHAE